MQLENSPSSFGFALTALDYSANFYSNLHNHETYKTTSGEIKNIFKANGSIRSARAARFANLSKWIKGLGFATSLLTTGYSGYQVYDKWQDGGGGIDGISNIDGWDAADLVVGSAGLTASAAILLGSNPIGWGIVGTAAVLYGSFRLGMNIYDEIVK